MEKNQWAELLITLGLCICTLVLGIVIGISRGVPFMERHTIQSIGEYTGLSPERIAPPPGLPMPVISPKSIVGIQTNSIADPFIAKTDTGWCLFFSVLNRSSGLGFIALAESRDARVWHYRRPVIEEQFSLAYPCVFHDHGSWYIIPDCSKSGQIRLYKAVDFPYKWKYLSQIMCGIYRNPTVVVKDSLCWLFAENPQGNLRLFYADSATGTWYEHPKSPVIKDNNRCSLPGGGIAGGKDSLFRVARDVYSATGSQIRIFRIDTLSKSLYSEHELQESPILSGSGGHDWNATGIGHLDLHLLSNGTWMGMASGEWNRIDFGLNY